MPAGRPADHDAASVSGYRVLLIDAARPDRELLRTWLEETSRFMVVGEAGDGPRGVALAAELRPDLVTLDMSMPEGDGIRTLIQILAVSPDSKVVVVSGFVFAGLAQATIDLGASACLDKNIDPDRLAEKLLDVLDRPQPQIS
jgi:DNA-binding NarL/FixJ family response regulator